VITELFHLVGDDRRGRAAAWKLVHSGAITLGTLTDADLPALEQLMAKYQDRPMNFADATLVHLAKREGIHTIFTVDNDDFETYRIDARKRFRVLPGRVL
jgi:predicted nucleic acid-binding protein